MIPIMFWELKQRKAYLFWWSFSIIATVALLLLIYPSIHNQAAQLNKVLSQLPATLRDLKTGGSQVDITTPVGYLHSQLYYITLPLLQIIMAVGLGSSLLSRDEQNHSLELLLARPISRGKVLAGKAMSGILAVSIVSTVATIVTIGLIQIVNIDVSLRYILLVNLYSVLFSLSFGAIAFTLSAASNLTGRLSMAVATVISFGGYLLASLSGMSHYIEVPAKLLPYHYYNPTQILVGNVSKGLNIYLVGIFVLCTIISWAGFRRRDIS